MLKSRVVPAAELTQSEIEIWDCLCKSHAHLETAFFSPHYTRAVAAVRPHVYVCVLLNGSDPVGFFPFQFASPLHRLFGAAERVGEELTDHFGLIAGPDVRVDVPTLLKRSGLSHINFTHLDDSQLAYGLEGERPEIGYLMRFDSGRAYWEQLRIVNRKYVSETERKGRQLEEQYGSLRFCWSEPNVVQHLQMLIRAKSDQYIRTGKDDWLAAGWKQRLLALFAASKASTCRGVLSSLYAGDTWVASHFGLCCGGVLHYWFPVYNTNLSRFGPGHLLRKALITTGTELGINTIDHGAGDALHKRVCTNAVRTYYRGAWFRPGLSALLCRSAYSAKWRWRNLRRASA